jgi:hypothetical protein
VKPKPFFHLGLSLLLFSAPAFAKNTAQWKVGLYGRATDDSLSNSRTVGVAGIVNVSHDLSSSLQARFLGGVLLETGASSALFTNEFEPRSRLLMQEASVRWNFLSGFSLLGGVLDQRHHGSPLLVESGSFPAAMLAYDNGPGGFIFHADAQGAIPVSRSFSTRSTGKDSTPVLLTQKLIIGFEDRPGGFKGLLRANHFQFSGLTHGLAQDSRFYGNTIAGPGPAARFLYRYEGFEAGPDFIVRIGTKTLWTLGGSYLQNTKGPRQSDEGTSAYTSVGYYAKSFVLKPGVQFYRNEPDSSPGFFSSTEFGHNNRRGFGASVRLELREIGMDFEVKARRSRLIEPRAFQRDRFDYVEFSVELPYANF